MPLRKEVDLEKTVAAASGVFRDVCSEELPYHTAEELWEGLKQGDEGARFLFVFFLRLRKNERTRCSVEKAIAAEGKRWVGVLIEEAWRLHLLMHHRAVPDQGKPKSVVAVEGSSKVRSDAIQRTFAEGEGRSQVTDYMGQNLPTVGCVVDGQLVQQTVYHKS